MKFCIQCGSKLLPVNGAYPKFCGNCGHAVGAQILAKKDTVKKIEKEDDFEVDALQFDLQVEEDVAIKAENLLGTSDSVSQASRRTNNITSLEQLRQRMKQNNTQDA
jgi:DNA-directed RNA polymerase subunit M/transcription elongation factor TFIIS